MQILTSTFKREHPGPQKWLPKRVPVGLRTEGPGGVSGGEKTLENVTFGSFRALAKTGGPGPPLRNFQGVSFEVHFGLVFDAFRWLCWGSRKAFEESRDGERKGVRIRG